MDYAQLDQFCVDIGKETCDPEGSLATHNCEIEPQIYPWKRCCLKNHIKHLYDGEPPAAGGPGQRYYEQNMLHQACSLTSKTPKRSVLREGGLFYSQYYGSVKELSDASNCKAFDNDGLEDCALDPEIRQGIHAAVRGHLRELAAIERAYKANKQRADTALSNSLHRSSGIRKEHRITGLLFQELRSQMHLRSAGALTSTLLACLSYAWAVKSEVYLDFLRRSADKFATDFEMVLAKSERGLVSQQETRLMAMFLRCLRFAFGGHQLQRESALCWVRKEQSGVNRLWIPQGLGYGKTLARYGYCWTEQIFYWSQIRFRTPFADQVPFGSSVLHGQHIRRRAELQAFFDSIQRIVMAIEWLGEDDRSIYIQDRLISWLVHICLQQFRLDILHRVKRDIREDQRADAFKGEEPFSREYFREIFNEGVYMISGNRCDIKSVSSLAYFLFNFDDDLFRTH